MTTSDLINFLPIQLPNNSWGQEANCLSFSHRHAPYVKLFHSIKNAHMHIATFQCETRHLHTSPIRRAHFPIRPPFWDGSLWEIKTRIRSAADRSYCWAPCWGAVLNGLESSSYQRSRVHFAFASCGEFPPPRAVTHTATLLGWVSVMAATRRRCSWNTQGKLTNGNGDAE